MAYTIADTPRIERRIGRDLDEVLETVRAGDPCLRALILTGGFARGEGSVLDGRPQNDYDLVAVRSLGAGGAPYDAMRQRLESRLGLHIDLAPVPAWRLRWAPPTIFWYETALRGRTLWGPDLLGRIRVRDAASLDGAEGLRLLVNRAAGLLFATEQDADAKRLQASKALLAALDAGLLATGHFAPSQRERWQGFQDLRSRSRAPPELERMAAWLAWAFLHKTDPAATRRRDAGKAWHAAAEAVLDVVPMSLRRAGLASLDDYARRDGIVDHLYYYRTSARIPGARRWARHPTSRVRVATLRMLEDELAGRRHGTWPEQLAGLADPPEGAQTHLRALEALRTATLQ